MIGNIAADFLTQDIVWVHVQAEGDYPERDVVWSGKILDVQPYGLMIKVLSISIDNRVTAFCEGPSAVRFLPWHMVKFVTVREGS